VKKQNSNTGKSTNESLKQEPKKKIELGNLKTEKEKEKKSELEMYSKEWKKKKKIGL